MSDARRSLQGALLEVEDEMLALCALVVHCAPAAEQQVALRAHEFRHVIGFAAIQRCGGNRIRIECRRFTLAHLNF